MHILRNTQPVPGFGGILPPGEWLFNDQNAFTVALAAEAGTVRLDKWDDFKKEFWPANPKAILLIRSGAIGDLLLLSPAILALQNKYPSANIALSCLQRHWPVVSAVEIQPIDYPVAVSVLGDYDLIIPLENVVEIETEKHAMDAFAAALGVKVEDYKPVYDVKGEEKLWAELMWRKRVDNETNQWIPRVALHLCASSRIRNYPFDLWKEVMASLLKRGWEVMLFGSAGQLPPIGKNAHPGLKDCTHLTFREAAAVLATCDVFCGVDSSFFNLCPALGVPAVGLFGPVDWKLRVKEGSGQTALHGEAPCAPCGWTNSRAGVMFPPHGPCAQLGHCKPLSEIRPERIVSVIEREAKNARQD